MCELEPSCTVGSTVRHVAAFLIIKILFICVRDCVKTGACMKGIILSLSVVGSGSHTQVSRHLCHSASQQLHF